MSFSGTDLSTVLPDEQPKLGNKQNRLSQYKDLFKHSRPLTLKVSAGATLGSLVSIPVHIDSTFPESLPFDESSNMCYVYF